MKIIILSHAASLEDLLSKKLHQIGLLSPKTADYTKPIFPQIEEADVLVNGLGRIDKMIIDASPKLKLVHQIGTGVDNIDIDYCTSKSIYVANIPNVNNVSVAEHTLFLMIYLAKNMKSAGSSLMKRRVVNVLGSELKGKILLIIGFGATGREVAKRAKSFGMKVIAITKNPDQFTMKITTTKTTTTPISDSINHNNSNITDFVDDIKDVNYLHESLAKADYISLHTPLTTKTLGMIGHNEIDLMKKSAFLINVARASIVDRKALFMALRMRRIAGAAFDVFWEEPANPEDKLLALDNFVLTPHIAGWTKESAEIATTIITNNIIKIMHGEVPIYAVNVTNR